MLTGMDIELLGVGSVLHYLTWFILHEPKDFLLRTKSYLGYFNKIKLRIKTSWPPLYPSLTEIS